MLLAAEEDLDVEEVAAEEEEVTEAVEVEEGEVEVRLLDGLYNLTRQLT